MNTQTPHLDMEVIFVCDPFEDDEDSQADCFTKHGDRPEKISFELILRGLTEAVSHVTYYKTLPSLIDNLKNHQNSVVFPYWFGELSRNRHSLVPAICESYNIPYVGADAFTKVVCNDKHLSKLICRDAGLKTPRGFVITCSDELSLLDNCSFPIVLKPLCQGSSLGISEQNLVYDPTSGRAVAEKISRTLGWPIICEEFVMGREVSLCMIGKHGSPPEIRAISWAIDGDQGYLDERLFTYALKYLNGCTFTPVPMEHILTDRLRISCEKLFRLLDKVEIIRIDGRITSNGLTVIELSPDLDLRPDGELAVAFSEISYPKLLRRLILNTLERIRT